MNYVLAGDGMLANDARMTDWRRVTGIGDLDRLDRAIVALVAVLVAGTVLMLALPGIGGHVAAPGLDLVLDTTATVVTATVAALAWVRFAEHREPVAHVESAAFLVLALVNGVAVAVSIATYPGANDGLLRAGQDQAYVFTAGRFLAAGLLVFGGIASLRGSVPRYPIPMLLAPAIAMCAVIAGIEAMGEGLPRLVVDTAGLGPASQPDVSTTPLGIVAQGGGAVLTMAAAAVWYRLWRRNGSVSHAYLTLGLIIASFAQLHTVVYPAVHPLQVSSGDLLWLAFGAVLVLSAEAEARSTLAALRNANSSLAQLREVEIERAALEERTRLSRELHDGLAQDLWLAKLKAGRLSAMPDLGPEAAILCMELGGAIEAGLADARQAVIALRSGGDGIHASLCDLIHRYVDDFADRFGLPAEYECDGNVPRLNSRTEAELLRIAQEALTNARRHADATMVKVNIAMHDGRLALTIRDNGRGFDPAAVPPGSVGLAGMRERAGLIHGDLLIESRPSDGTRVTVAVPVGSSGQLGLVRG